MPWMRHRCPPLVVLLDTSQARMLGETGGSVAGHAAKCHERKTHWDRDSRPLVNSTKSLVEAT